MAVMLNTPALAQGCSEPDLIAAARDGDDRAFEELYARYHDRISTFILGRVRDQGRAEDIAQEVFMSALRRLRASDQALAFKPWIYEIAKNACIDEFRRRQRLREVSLDADEELTGGPRALHSVAPTPPAAVEGKQRMHDLRAAFGGLSESHHKLLVMRELEGLSYEEIGQRTGMSRQMVESTLFRARRKLTAEYEELASGRRCQQVESLIADGRAQSARALGARERRQVGRHLAHCQPCRMTARVAGVDEALFRPQTIADKIAALLPIPLWRWLSRRTGRGRGAVARAAANPVTQQLQNAAVTTDATGPAASLGGAAIAAAVVALAGAGGVAVVAQAHDPTPTVVRAGHVSVSRNSGGAGHRQHASSGTGASMRSPSRAATTLRGVGVSTPGAGQSHTGAAGTTAGHGAVGSAPAAPGGTGGTPSVGSPLHAVNGVAGGASHLTQTAGGMVSRVANGAGSTVGHTVKALGGAVGSTTSTLGNTVKGAGSTVGSTVSGATSTVGSAVKGTTSTLGSTVKGTTSTVGSAVKGTTSTVGSAVSGAASTLGSALKGTTSTAGSTAGGAASTVGSAVKGTTSTVGSAVKGATSTAASTAGSTASTVGSAVKGTTSTAASTAGSTASTVGSTAKSTSGATLPSVTGAVKQATSGL